MITNVPEGGGRTPTLACMFQHILHIAKIKENISYHIFYCIVGIVHMSQPKVPDAKEAQLHCGSEEYSLHANALTVHKLHYGNNVNYKEDKINC